MRVWTQYYNARCEYASSEYVSTRLRRARVRRRTTKTVPSSSVSKSLYDEKMSKRRLAWGSLAASQVAKTGHLRILYDDTGDSCVFLLVYRCLLPFILLRAQQQHHRFKERGGKTRARTKATLSSCVFSFILHIIVIGCSARTISLSHHRFPMCSSFFPKTTLTTTKKKQNHDCCCCCFC